MIWREAGTLNEARGSSAVQEKGFMSKHEEADLILKLYDLRREETMRKARQWFFAEFHPQSMEDVQKFTFGETGAYLRMVLTYWDMAAALVNHGAISTELFNETNGEHILVFSRIEAFLPAARAFFGPKYLTSLEKLIDDTPGGRERAAMTRERMKEYSERLRTAQANASRA